MNNNPIIRTKLSRRADDGSIPCPACGGRGHNDDGISKYSTEETVYQAPTKCSTCDGCGRVFATYLPARKTP
jgi:DnaJ-class molecular chaperone